MSSEPSRPRYTDPMDAPTYNSRIVDNYVKLIRKKYPNIDVDRVLRAAGMTTYEVEDQGHWFSQNQINRFHERLAEITQNPNIAREAGRYAASPDAIGFMRPYILGMIDPERAYRMVNRTAQKLTRSTNYQSRKLDQNKMEITVTPEKGIQERPFQCQNRIGLFESVTLILSNKLPVIEHPQCVFKGDPCCRYLISWERSFSESWKKIRGLMAVLSPLIAMLLVRSYPQFSLVSVSLAFLSIFLLFSLSCEYLEKGELKASVNHLLDSSESLVEQVNVNYNRSILTNELGRAINSMTHIEGILEQVTGVLQTRLDFDRGIILLADPRRTRLDIRAAFGYLERSYETMLNTSFSLTNPASRGVFVVSFKEQQAYLINDVRQIQEDMSPKSFEFAKRMGSQSFICCPIVCDGESIGLLVVDNLESRRPLVQSDLVLLKGIASVLGVSLKNAELIAAKERQFSSLIRVLGASIDARDPLTSGHSEKVTEYAMGICEELNLDSDRKEAVRVAALLHDYGKIGVPDAVLKKPGRLTQKEIETVKTHSLKTIEILEKIHFEGIYSSVPEMAGGHHEKIDGSGYPYGLEGEEIHLGARIIAVADFFEAITAKRHYREPMDDLSALEMLKERTGSHFDTAVVNAFVNFYSRAYPDRLMPKAMSA
ncbi:MAG: HD domain-containing phosphohydrolase [Desulfobacterales bacterium]